MPAVHSLRFRRIALLAGSILVASALHAAASMDDEANLAADVIQKALIQVDSLPTPDRRATVLKDAVEAMDVLQKLAEPGVQGETAKAALDNLAQQAVTPDMLRLSLVDALSAGIVAGEPGLRRDLETKGILENITDPAYRSAAWSHLARAHMRVGEPAEAERLALRAVEDAKGIDRKQTRNGALRAAVLVFPFDGAHDEIIEIASNAMSTASARSEIYRMEAIAKIGDETKRTADALAASAKEFFAKKAYGDALTSTRALERDDDRRAPLLDQMFKAAVAAGDEGLGLQVLKSMAKDRDQDKALKALVDLRLTRGKPIRAKELIALMLTPGARVEAEIAIAKTFEQQGYQQAALDTLAALKISPQDDPDAAADLVAALASISAFDQAQAIADQITDAPRRSFAFSRLSKRLADDQRIDDARRFLGQVTEADDLAYARSGLARALVKDDRLDEAKSILKDLPDGADRDRVLEELAKRHADGGIDELRSIAGEMTTVPAHQRSLAMLAGALRGLDPGAAGLALDQALGLSDPSGTTVDGSGLAAIAVGYAGLGAVKSADTALAGINDFAQRDEAEAMVAGRLVETGSLDAARARLPRLSVHAQANLLAELAAAEFRADGDVENLVRAVHDLPFPIRVATLRGASEHRARTLDSNNWFENPKTDPLLSAAEPAKPEKANFMVGQHVVQAPAPGGQTLDGISMPDIFSLNAAAMRAQVPAPADGVAHLAILGFSPFSLEAFKLTSGGTAAIHQVQVSQQLTWPRYIAVQKGVVTLGSLLRDLPEALRYRLLVPKGDVLLVRVPIIVLPGATLLMSGSEFTQYQLGSQSGAFIAVAGKLVVQDADVIGYDEELEAAAAADETNKSMFRPFITGWGGSNLQISGSRFAMLGYDSSKAFGLTQSSGAAVQSLYALDENRPTGRIVENSFENLRYGYYSYEAKGVQLIGNEYRDNVVYGIDPHDRSRQMVIALNTVSGSGKKHGIIVSREVDDSFIVGNVSLWNKGSGFMLDRTSTRNVVYANTAFSNHGDGLTFYESGCNIAAANDFSRNYRAGIKVRNSTDVGMYNNRMDGNRASGADIYVSDLRASPEGRSRNFELDPYQPLTTTVISGNSFEANGFAINVDGASQTILDRNRFRDQRSNVYGGDLRSLSPYLLQLGETSAMLVGLACEPKPKMDSCGFNGARATPAPTSLCTGMTQPQQSGFAPEAGSNG